jgi:hypothetical protein
VEHRVRVQLGRGTVRRPWSYAILLRALAMVAATLKQGAPVLSLSPSQVREGAHEGAKNRNLSQKGVLDL